MTQDAKVGPMLDEARALCDEVPVSPVEIAVFIYAARASLRALVAHIETLDSRLTVLVEQRLALAKLASDTPQFNNPLAAWSAQELRDMVLQDAGLISIPAPQP